MKRVNNTNYEYLLRTEGRQIFFNRTYSLRSKHGVRDQTTATTYNVNRDNKHKDQSLN